MKLLNVKQMAEKLCSTVGTIYAWVSTQKIPTRCVIRVNRSLRFDEKAVDNWLASCKLNNERGIKICQ